MGDDQRPEGAITGPSVPGGAFVIADGRGHNPLGVGDLVRAAVQASGVRVGPDARHGDGAACERLPAGYATPDPAIVAEGPRRRTRLPGRTCPGKRRPGPVLPWCRVVARQAGGSADECAPGSSTSSSTTRTAV